MKTVRKILSVIICLVFVCMPLSAIGVSAAQISELTATIDTGASVTIKDTNGDGYYEIGTADELYAFAAIVNNGQNTINAILTNDIVVNKGTVSENSTNARVWEPIAEGPIDPYSDLMDDNDNLYLGVFDGNGKTISGLYYCDESEQYLGLFAGLGGAGEVKNLTITNSYICSTIFGYSYSAAFVAHNMSGTISNCTNSADVVGSQNVAGIVGYNCGTVINCTNTGSIEGDADLGGIAGSNEGNLTNCKNSGYVIGSFGLGGIVGYNTENVTGCVNEGRLKSRDFYEVNKPDNVGGIVGISSTGTISSCENTGYLDVVESSYAGGIVGYSSLSDIKNCTNSGKVECPIYAGGIAGYSDKLVTGCTNNGDIVAFVSIGGIVDINEGEISNCNNTGTLTYYSILNGEDLYNKYGGIEATNEYDSFESGGICGKSIGGTVSCCTNSGGVTFRNGLFTGGIVGNSISSVVKNCVNHGKIFYTVRPGGIVGKGTDTTIENCYNTYIFKSFDGFGGIIKVYDDTVTVKNCYCLSTDYDKFADSELDGIEMKTSDQLASGEVAYALQGNQKDLVWGQTIGTDKYPVVGGTKVYYGYEKCTDESKIYSNDVLDDYGHHYDENGVCVDCDHHVSATTDSYYIISNAGQLLDFAEIVNSSSAMNQRAILINDIDMSGVEWKGIATSSSASYTGTFDGQGHTIKNLNQNTNIDDGSRLGLFISIGKGGEVKNLVIDNANVWSSNQYNKSSSAALAFCNNGTIKNCIVKNSTIQLGAHKYLGGIAGFNDENGVIENCAVINTNITRRWGGANNRSMGGIVQKNNGVVNNCYTYGCTFNNGAESKSAVVAFGNAPQNCYYYTESAVDATNATAMSKEQFNCGEVSYLLGSVWGQTIGADQYPIIGGKTVYLILDSDNNRAYSNTNISV